MTSGLQCSAPLGPCRSATEDADTVPNVWTVIKPGHVREKIAIFASEATRMDGADSGDCSSRRRRCLTEEEQKISVVEMVAFLEQRASELQPNLKPLLNEPDIVRVSCWTQPQPQPSSGPPETLTAVRVELPVQVKPAVRVESPAWVLPPTPAAPSQEVSREMAGLRSAEQEPLPGLLFRTTFYLEPALPPVSVPQRSEKNKVHKTMGCPSCSAAVPLGRSASVSQDFLRVRQRLQQLLAPQSYLLLLPHHLLVNLLLLLPTQSLAALKCTCSYFKFVIENYSVRPADSLWVSDPRYRDDPCKQCKKRYRPGDVSLCRWHHKPYCQALPYGPGYWMCCHGAQRDAPGCNVGLHDNRWVPAFHSINVPIYRRNYHYES
uniref:F-box domain-containing protein n=1 Tax=Poecilia mexicana TaxID=48701 RepID=A0A3B3YGP0_9TELE